jgi:hypothetical protein
MLYFSIGTKVSLREYKSTREIRGELAMANLVISLETESGAKTTTDRFERSIKTYQANVFCQSLAKEKNIEYFPNPRRPKDNLNDDILDALSLGIKPDIFHLAANGIYLFANKVEIKENNMIVHMSSNPKDLEGIANGGHLYAAIQEQYQSGNLPSSKRVPVTIYTGLDFEDKLEVVFGLNNNVEVTDHSHMNMAGDFDFIKKALKSTSYSEEQVKYFQNDTGVQDVLGIIQLMKCFIPTDKDFDTEEPYMPKSAYGAVQNILADFRNSNKNYKLVASSLSEIMEFRDLVQARVDAVCNDHKKISKIMQTEKPFALTKFSGKKPETNPLRTYNFGTEYPNYILNKGTLYPLLASFRVFINDEGVFDLETAKECFGIIGDKLISDTILACQDFDEIRKYVKADMSWIRLFEQVNDWANYNKISTRGNVRKVTS